MQLTASYELKVAHTHKHTLALGKNLGLRMLCVCTLLNWSLSWQNLKSMLPSISVTKAENPQKSPNPAAAAAAATRCEHVDVH